MSAENSVVLMFRRGTKAILAKDLAAYGDLLAEEYRWEDRRSGLSSTHGKREEIEQARVLADLGLERVDIDVLETRGDAIALCRFTSHAEGFEVVLVLVTRVDAEGRAVHTVAYDEEDLDAAVSELEAQSAEQQ